MNWNIYFQIGVLCSLVYTVKNLILTCKRRYKASQMIKRLDIDDECVINEELERRIKIFKEKSSDFYKRIANESLLEAYFPIIVEAISYALLWPIEIFIAM